MYISYPVFDYGRITRSLAGRDARPIYQGLGGLHGRHGSVRDFPEPNNCWKPGSTAKPDWSKTIVVVEAKLIIPATCTGSIIAKTIVRDWVPGGGHSIWAKSIRFGVSDGTHTGGLEKATTLRNHGPGGAYGRWIEFEKKIPWDGHSCTATNDLFVYVKSGQFTFIEIGFYPRVESARGVLIDKSLDPAIRLKPCNNLIPIRSPYTPGVESQRYRNLPESERKQVNQDVDRRFREETGVARTLDWNKPKDRPLLRHWLRIRDSVMRERQRLEEEKETKRLLEALQKNIEETCTLLKELDSTVEEVCKLHGADSDLCQKHKFKALEEREKHERYYGRCP